ncbi:MAG: NADH-quinone oxidoreductase subunit NuoK [Planctomycetota bacterium]|nr:MAG: NADH-quinone oxidoreductase subunit NuoK [Planctomycetota bacterium]
MLSLLSSAPLVASRVASSLAEQGPTIPSSQLLILAAVLFSLGLLGYLVRQHLIVMFLSIQLMLNAANLSFLAAARDGGFDANGQVYALLVMVLAAVEAAIGLAILIAIYRQKGSLDTGQASQLRG